MGWAENYINKLKLGETVSFRPRGNSMSGKVESGDLVTIRPVTIADVLEPGDIVLCKVAGREYFHLIKAVRGSSYQIGNNRGGVNGLTSHDKIFGVCVSIEK